MTQRYSWPTSQIPAINAHLLSAEEANAGITEPWGAEVTTDVPLNICGLAKLGKASQWDFMPRLCTGGGGSCPSRSESPFPGSPRSRGCCPCTPSPLTYRRLTGTSVPARPVLLQHSRDAPHSAQLHPEAPSPGWVSEQPDELTGNQEKPGCHRAPRQSWEEVRGQDGNVCPRQCLPVAH